MSVYLKLKNKGGAGHCDPARNRCGIMPAFIGCGIAEATTAHIM